MISLRPRTLRALLPVMRGICKIAAAIVLLSAPAGSGALAQDTGTRPALTIDVPVKLATAKVVFNIGRPAFEGDEPTGLAFLRIMSSRFREAGTESRLVAVFHGEPGYILLDDESYNRVRHWTGGNLSRDNLDHVVVLPHPGMLPSRGSVASSECSRSTTVTSGDNTRRRGRRHAVQFPITERCSVAPAQSQPRVVWTQTRVHVPCPGAKL